MNDSQCPDRGQLRAYSADATVGTGQSQIRHHLDNCEDCRAFVHECREFAEQVRHSMRSSSVSGTTNQPDPGDPVAPELMDETTGITDHAGIGESIGPYRLLEVIGEGGMGQVFRAEQREPVKRMVALKLVKAGMDTKQVIARFEAERQALAMMSHPGIAQVLDAGATSSGRPYFVMELVSGQPLNTFCDHHKLSIRQRLELFQKICQAIQHAHQKGIIHRDLKPSNILVTMSDNDPVPKVIDFGLAKATGHSLTDKTMFTQLGQIVGTFQYMSPEQADSNESQIDTRTDIYSLGVILYELLAGSTPLTRESIRDAAVVAILSRIRDEEPTRPSSRIIESTDSLDSISTVRNVEPRKMSGLLRGDLDWIVMKALDKDPNRRYETANGLGLDIGRHLNSEPVTACPPSTAYRLRKFAGKNKGLIASLATVGLVLISASVVSLWQAYRATHAEEAAAQSEQQAVREAEISKAINVFLSEDLLAKASPYEEPDPNISLRTVLERATLGIKDRFWNQPHVESALRLTLGETWEAIGDRDKATEQFRRAYELRLDHLGGDHQETLEAKSMLAMSYLPAGNYDRAESQMQEVYDSTQDLLPANHSFLLRIRSQLARIHAEQVKTDLSAGEFDELLPLIRSEFGELHEETYTIMAELASLASNTRAFDQAVERYLELIEFESKKFGKDHPFTLQSRKDLAHVYDWQNRFADAKELLTSTLAACKKKLPKDHPTTLNTQLELGTTLFNIGEFEESEKHFLECHQGYLRKFGKDDVRTLQAEHMLAWYYQGIKANAKALPWAKSSLEGARKLLGPEHPNTMIAHLNFGILLRDTQRYKEAMPVLKSCLEIERRISPGRRRLAVALSDLALLYQDMGQFDKAEPLHAECLRLRESLMPKDALTFVAMYNLGATRLRLDDLKSAQSLLETAYSGFVDSQLASNQVAYPARCLIRLIRICEALDLPEKQSHYQTLFDKYPEERKTQVEAQYAESTQSSSSE